jgi:hypothetical protein
MRRSSVLPVPFAFSHMGVLLGVVTMAVVAYSNSLTSVLLLRAAGLTGHDSYEGVAQAVGGRAWKVGRLFHCSASFLRAAVLTYTKRPHAHHNRRLSYRHTESYKLLITMPRLLCLIFRWRS